MLCHAGMGTHDQRNTALAAAARGWSLQEQIPVPASCILLTVPVLQMLDNSFDGMENVPEQSEEQNKGHV